MEIDKHVAIVTGGASGLGEACVRALVKEGAKVAVLDLDEDRGKAISSELAPAVIFCKTDVPDERSVNSAVERVVELFGSLQIAINCAGIGPAEKILGKKGLMPLQHFTRVIDINLIGTFNVMRYAVEKMFQNLPNEDKERGVIINTASIAAFEGQIGQTAYSASKAAVVGMTLPAAREFADFGVRVVTIVPGIFETPLSVGLPDKVKESLTSLIPFPRRFGKPEEFAMLAKQIIVNPFLNGTTIRLDASLRMASR
jgi:3-hydroxyacyl-CoA dehydrogenase / 3-hydroxy-2-methylbutyryl-CoA dehydrogenase